VDSCVFYNISENPNINTIGNQVPVRMDGSDGMIIRNCFAARAEKNNGDMGGAMFLNFNGRDTLVENCTIHQIRMGLAYQKQYSVGDDGLPLTAWTVRNCYSNEAAQGACNINQDNSYQCPGNHFLYNNIVVNAEGRSYAGEWFGVSGSALQGSIAPRETSAGITTVEHNTFILAQGPSAIMLRANGVGITGRGNIFGVGTKVLESQYKDRVSPNEGVHEFDYNLYSGQQWSFQSPVEGSKRYESLAAWQAAQASDHINLAVSNPDPNSIRWGTDPTYAALFTNYAARDFTYAPGSPAIGFMPDGTNAGHYRTGDEVIGCRIPWIDLRQFWADIPDWLNPGRTGA
jgi:hypothetical protein